MLLISQRARTRPACPERPPSPPTAASAVTAAAAAAPGPAAPTQNSPCQRRHSGASSYGAQYGKRCFESVQHAAHHTTPGEEQPGWWQVRTYKPTALVKPAT